MTEHSRTKPKALWQLGDLFHVSTRYPRKHKARKVDRLAGILGKGLVAPARCRDGSVFSDLNIVVTGCSVPYDDLVFLHLYNSESWLYTISDPGRFAVFVDPAVAVLTPEEMGEHWALLCQDEVYVRGGVALEHLIAVAVDPAVGDSVISEFRADFESLQIPLYDYAGNVVWQPG